MEGAETPIFKQFFKDWPEAGGQQGLGQVKRGNVGEKIFLIVPLSICTYSTLFHKNAVPFLKLKISAGDNISQTNKSIYLACLPIFFQ